jgi:hypothetical protein
MKILIAIVLLLLSPLAIAQSGGPVTFSGTNVKDNAEVSIDNFKDKPGVVVIFTGYQCPFDGYYRLRIRELISTYSERVPFLLVNSYLEPEESVEKMKMEAVANGYSVPYLADKEQKIMNALGARKSPEVFLLQRKGDGFTIIYSGAIDDNPQLPSGVKEHHLVSALDKMLAGSSGIPSVRATGCTIRKR